MGCTPVLSGLCMVAGAAQHWAGRANPTGGHPAAGLMQLFAYVAVSP